MEYPQNDDAAKRVNGQIPTCHALVFGSGGVGKTSMCNELTNEAENVGSSVMGVTFESRQTRSVIRNGVRYVITDTIGLNESSEGTVPGPEAIRALIKLLRDSRRGFNILIHVARANRYSDTERNNYRLFVETIASRKIPTLLVATGCEALKPMTRWRDENRARLHNNLGVEYADVVCTSFARGEWDELEEIFKRRRSESVRSIWDAVRAHELPVPVSIYKSPSDFERLVKKTWNRLCRALGWTTYIVPLNAALQAFLQKIGLGKEEAQHIIEEEGL